MTTTEGAALDREAIGRVDSSDQATDILAIPEHLRDALWKVESAGLTPLGQPRRPRRRRHGRLGHRRRAGARDPRRPGLAAGPERARVRAAALDDAGHHRAVRQLLGRHRGDARLLRGRGRDRGAPRRGRPRAAGWPSRPARERRARHPGRRRLPAAGGRGLHDGRRPRGRRAVRRRAAAEPRDRRRRRAPRGSRGRLGARRRRALRAQGARACAARHRPGHRRRRAHHADRLPLEVPDQRERQDAGLLRPSCPSSTTTRSWAGRGRRSTAFSAVFLDDSDTHPRVASASSSRAG